MYETIVFSYAMSWFPFNYRDVSGFRSEMGLELTTPSDEAAKYFDAAIAQVDL